MRVLYLIPLLGAISALTAQQPGAYTPPLTIAVINQSVSVADSDVASWTAAIARQVHEDLAPVWKTDAQVVFQSTPPSGAWICTLDDTGEAANVSTVGVHFIQSDGKPGCVVHAGLIVSAGLGSVSQRLSHEILEMLVDPWLGNVSFAPAIGPNSATVYLREVCDPVVNYTYTIDGVTVSDFTYPDFWLGGVLSQGAKLDQLGLSTLSLQPTAHSYMLVRFISSSGGINSLDSWSYIWGSYCMFGPC